MKDIRDLIHMAPFRPFRLHLADGKSMSVPHPDFFIVGGDLIVVANELPNGSPGDLNFIPCEYVVRIEMLGSKTRKAA